jgi:hypothetical protein
MSGEVLEEGEARIGAPSVAATNLVRRIARSLAGLSASSPSYEADVAREARAVDAAFRESFFRIVEQNRGLVDKSVSLGRLLRAARAMLVGVAVHNERVVPVVGVVAEISGAVVDELSAAVTEAEAVEPARAGSLPSGEALSKAHGEGQEAALRDVARVLGIQYVTPRDFFAKLGIVASPRPRSVMNAGGARCPDCGVWMRDPIMGSDVDGEHRCDSCESKLVEPCGDVLKSATPHAPDLVCEVRGPHEEHRSGSASWTRSAEREPAAPIPMLLRCPWCGERHYDLGEFAERPHKTHACQECGELFTPALVPTVGVRFLPGCKNEEPSG